MIRLRNLVRTPQIAVLRLDHEPDVEHSDPEAEVCSNYAVNFVEAGSFGLAAYEKNWMLSPGYVFLSQPGAVHRYMHHETTPSDVCLSVTYSAPFVEAISPGNPLVLDSIPVAMPPTNRLAFLKFRLTQLTSDSYTLA